VIRLKYWLAICLCLGALSLQARSQALPEPSNSGAESPPPFGVLDKDGFLNRNAGSLKRISDHVRQLEQDHGYRIFLVVEPLLMTSSASERASELRQAWLPEGNGLVVVFESNTRTIGIGRDMADDPNPAAHPSRVPSYQIVAILSRTLESVDSKLPAEAYIETIMENLTTGFDDYFVRRDTPPPPERKMKIGLLVVGTLSLLGLGAIGLGGLVRHSSMTPVRRFRFPVVDRPERLGAPCGGNVTARRFAAPTPRV
jgi:hypothetical protein